MSPEEIYHLIRDNNLFRLSVEIVDELRSMNQATYNEIVVHLLTDDGEYARSKEGYDGHYDYRCQLEGCELFMLRPSAEIYHHVLDNSVRIGDPSSCEAAVVALLQIKAAHDVAVDFLELINKHSGNDQVQSRIFNMFYWLGMRPEALSRNIAWPGRHGGHLYARWFGSNRSLMRGQTDPITGHPLTPSADPARAREVAQRIIEKMLELFEANNANQTARSIIGLLPDEDRDYLVPYRERIIRAYKSGQSSSDEYVRHRASQSGH